ncbi:hypothetical protein Theos_1534 [Thermus oshimai JL-2]|uniref:DUF5723 domain-containing protein n=1 Tax=Thermus oshimai JL-2 TaxID=751945 RepID=K7RJG0_THEOS|nr:hypothetical protein Theos_1534 [Thermus oshimai JL-2]
MRRAFLWLLFWTPVALAQVPFHLGGPADLSLEGGWRLGLPGLALSVENNALTGFDLVNIAALLRDPKPTDLLLVAARIPAEEGSTALLQGGVRGLAVSFPLGQDPLTGLASGAVGLDYRLQALGSVRVSPGLISLAQEGFGPGDVLLLEGTQAEGLLFHRMALQGALPILDGLLVVGAEVALLYGVGGAYLTFQQGSALSYDNQGLDGQVSLLWERGGHGLGFQVGFGLRTQLPTVGFSVYLRPWGRVWFRGLERTAVSLTAQDATALEVLECLRDGQVSSTVNCAVVSGQGERVFHLPFELGIGGFYPIFLGDGPPLYLTARADAQLGGVGPAGWRYSLGASYPLFPGLNTAVEVSFGGPAGLGAGLTLGWNLEAVEGYLRLVQRGGVLLGAKGAQLEMGTAYRF